MVRSKKMVLSGIQYYAHRLNNSKFFAGLVMIMLNVGSKYIAIKLSKTQEQYLRNTMARQMLIFSIFWMGTRDVIISLFLTAAFTVMADHLFNEESPFCIVPHSLRKYEKLLDFNEDGRVSPKELDAAIGILQKVKSKRLEEQKNRHYRRV